MKGKWKIGNNYCLKCDRDLVPNGKKCQVCGWSNKVNKKPRPNKKEILKD